VFRLPDGEFIQHERLAKNFKLLRKHCERLENTLLVSHVAYARYDIPMPPSQCIDGLDMETLAVQMGTCIAMPERHHSKLKPHMKFGKQSGNGKKLHGKPETSESEEKRCYATWLNDKNNLIFKSSHSRNWRIIRLSNGRSKLIAENGHYYLHGADGGIYKWNN